MILGDLCEIKTNFPEADFWLTNDSKPTKNFNSVLVGIKVHRTDILVPGYLYYLMEYLHNMGYFIAMSKPINPEDIKEIKVGV